MVFVIKNYRAALNIEITDTTSIGKFCGGTEVFLMVSVKPVHQLPSCYPPLEIQVELVRRFLANCGIANLYISPDLLDQISYFVPRTASEVPLIGAFLHGDNCVENTFREYWRAIKAPKSKSIKASNSDGKLLWDDLETDSKHIRLLPGTENRHRPGIRLMAIEMNINIYQETPVASCWKNSAIAPYLTNIEILMLAALAPELVSSWDGSGSPYPYMPGYQFHLGPEGWIGSLSLGRWCNEHNALRPLAIRALWAGLVWDGKSVPTVREVGKC